MRRAYVHRPPHTRGLERHIGAHRTGARPVKPVKRYKDLVREPLLVRLLRALVRGR